MTRKFAHFIARLEPGTPTPDADSGTTTAPTASNEFLATFLVGDGTYNGLFVPTDELAKAAESMNGQPVNIDHSDRVEDEVGFVRQPTMLGSALKGFIVLNPETAKFGIARAYIQNRLAASKPPEVSVGFFFDAAEENGAFVARNIQFDHLALVTRGACSPANGCGVGLSKETPPMSDTPTPQPAPEPAKAEAETPAPPCGCKAQMTELEKARDAAAARLKAYEDREIAALRAQAESLGAPVEATDGISCLQKKIKLAEAVRAKFAQLAPEAGTRQTKPVSAGADDADAHLARLTAGL